jgi:hypothetical protein
MSKHIDRTGMKVDGNDIDGVLNERCIAYIKAQPGVEQTAALHEFVDDVMKMVDLISPDALHRHSIVVQAIYNVGYFGNRMIPNVEGKDLVILDLTQKFATALVQAPLDEKYGNSVHEETGADHIKEVEDARKKLRSAFIRTVKVTFPAKPEIPRNDSEADKWMA